ncbi:MAG: hypothetical protein ACLR5G_12695 [Eubacteriales bacterium]
MTDKRSGNRLDEALGYIDGALISGALTETGKESRKMRRIRMRFVPLAAALAVLLTIGAAAIGIRYFAPGYGIVDGGVKMLTAKESVRLADTAVEAVMLTESDEGNTLTVWLWRENEVEITEDERTEGRPPAALGDLTAEINGNVYDDPNWGGGTSGYVTYMFGDVEAGTSVILRSAGDEVTVELTDARTANKSGRIKYGRRQIDFIQVTDKDDLWAAEIYDPFAKRLLDDNIGVQAHLFMASDTDGGVGYYSGNATVVGGKVSNDLVKANIMTHGKNIGTLYLKSIIYALSFRSADIPDVKISIPEIGETKELNLVLYDNRGIRVRLKSVTRSEKGLSYDCVTEDTGGLKWVSALTDVRTCLRRDYEYEVNGETISAKNALTPVYTVGSDLCVYDFPTDSDIALSAGDEVVVRLDDIRIQYGETGMDIEPYLGKTEVK